MEFTLQQKLNAVLLALGLHALLLFSLNRAEPGELLTGLEGFHLTVTPPAFVPEEASPVPEAPLEALEAVEMIEEIEQVEIAEIDTVEALDAVELIEIKPEPVPDTAPTVVVKQKLVKKMPPKKDIEPPARADPRQKADNAHTQQPTLSQGFISDSGVSTTFKASYRATISAILKRHKRYPSRALRRGQEGTVSITFIIGKDGNLTGWRITDSSGYRVLDKEVEKMLKRAAPFPPFPGDMEQESITLALPVDFYIKP